MGANLAIFGFSDKIKTAAQALKDAEERGAQDRYENGHSYSGTMGMLSFRVVNRVFDTVEDFEQMFMVGGPYGEKGNGIIAQVRVVRETKPLIKAQQAWYAAESAVRNANRWRPAGEKGPTPGQKKRILEKAEKAKAKYRKLLAAQAVKSKKTRFIGGGWCSS